MDERANSILKKIVYLKKSVKSIGLYMISGRPSDIFANWKNR